MTFHQLLEMLFMVVLMLIGPSANQPDANALANHYRQDCQLLLAQMPQRDQHVLAFMRRVQADPNGYPNYEARLQRCIEIWDSRAPNDLLRVQRNRMQQALDFLRNPAVNPFGEDNAPVLRVQQLPVQAPNPNRPLVNNAQRVQPMRGFIPLRPAPNRNQAVQQGLEWHCTVLMRQHEQRNLRIPLERIRELVPQCIDLWEQLIAATEPGTARHRRLNRQFRLLHIIQVGLPGPPDRDNQIQRAIAGQKKASSSSLPLWIGLSTLALVICSIGVAFWWRSTARNGAMSIPSSEHVQSSQS